jgi:hypothetical protein
VPAALLWICETLMGACVPTAAQEMAPASSCSWEVGDQQHLVLASGPLAYVEPRSLSATSRGVLILGSPSYVWLPGYRSGSLVSRDTTVGVLVRSSGAASAVESPIPGAEIGGISAIGNEDGTWSVAFTVLRPGTGFPGAKVAGRIGYGVFDGSEWSDVETESLPDDVALNPVRHARLARGSGGLIWAFSTRAAAANAGVAVLRRPADDWLLRAQAPSRVFGVSTAYIPMRGEVVAVARADTVGVAPRGTLHVEVLDPEGGGAEGFTIDPGPGNLWDPVFDRGRDPRWIGWLSEAAERQGERMEARVAAIHSWPGPRTVLVVDSSSVALHPVGLLGDGASYWVSHHLDHQSEILISRTVEGRAEVVFSMPNPFDGPFGAVARGPSEVLLAGPLRARDERSPPVTTLLIDVQRICRG